MEIITYETDHRIYKESLLKYTCSEFDVKLTVLGLGEDFVGVYQKILAFSEYVKSLDDDTLVMCCDSRDVFVWADSQSISEKYESMTDLVLFGDDPLCFPMLPLYKYYPKDTYLCSGVYIGRAGKLKEMFKYAIYCHDNLSDVMMEKFSITDDEIDAEEYVYEERLGPSIRQCDQFMCSLVYLTTDYAELDYGSELIQTFYQCPDGLAQYKRIAKVNNNVRSGRDFDLVFDRETKRIYNEHMDTYPWVFHAAGPPHSISMLNKYIKDDYGTIARLFS